MPVFSLKLGSSAINESAIGCFAKSTLTVFPFSLVHEKSPLTFEAFCPPVRFCEKSTPQPARLKAAAPAPTPRKNCRRSILRQPVPSFVNFAPFPRLPGYAPTHHYLWSGPRNQPTPKTANSGAKGRSDRLALSGFPAHPPRFVIPTLSIYHKL